MRTKGNMNEVVTIDELPELIKRRMPTPQHIKHLAILKEAKAVSFEWQSRKFAIKTTLETFEVKGENLIITGASQLIQTVCRTTVGHQKVIEEIVKLLRDADELFRSQRELALQKVASAKSLLSRLTKPSGPTAVKR